MATKKIQIRNASIMHLGVIATLSGFNVVDLKIVSISSALLVFHFLQSLGGFSAHRHLAFSIEEAHVTDSPPVLREAITAVILT